jgi:hypothetical protein
MRRLIGLLFAAIVVVAVAPNAASAKPPVEPDPRFNIMGERVDFQSGMSCEVPGHNGKPTYAIVAVLTDSSGASATAQIRGSMGGPHHEELEVPLADVQIRVVRHDRTVEPGWEDWAGDSFSVKRPPGGRQYECSYGVQRFNLITSGTADYIVLNPLQYPTRAELAVRCRTSLIDVYTRWGGSLADAEAWADAQLAAEPGESPYTCPYQYARPDGRNPTK